MPTFHVIVREVHCQAYRVETDTRESAILAVELGGGVLIESAFEYSHALDPDTWTVEETLPAQP